MGVSPGRDTGCAESVCTPGETIVARKTVFPGRDEFLCVLDYYCIIAA